MDRITECLSEGDHTALIKKALSLFPHRKQANDWPPGYGTGPTGLPLLSSLPLCSSISWNRQWPPGGVPSPFQDVLSVLYEGRAKAIELDLPARRVNLLECR